MRPSFCAGKIINKFDNANYGKGLLQTYAAPEMNLSTSITQKLGENADNIVKITAVDKLMRMDFCLPIVSAKKPQTCPVSNSPKKGAPMSMPFL